MLSEPASIPVFDFILDIQNPRFLTQQPTQEDIRLYLLRHAGVIELAKRIRDYGSLYPGERIVVFKNTDGKYVVLEGNRRICACQMFLKPKWIPSEYRSMFPSVTTALEESIKQIATDVLKRRDEADSFLTSRHIGGVELWDPLAKKKFFVDRFESGRAPDDIAQDTNFQKSEIINDINEYYLFMKAYDLPCWTSKQKKNELNLYDIKIDLFLRIFNTRGAKKAMHLKYDKVTLQPESGLPADVFSAALQRVMYCAYITNDDAEKIDTRTKGWASVPGLTEILNLDNRGDKKEETKKITGRENTGNADSVSPATEQENPSTPVFFQNLSWRGIDVADSQNRGLVALAEEMNEMSKSRRGGAGYKNYPIAATVLARSLPEQTLKYNLRKVDPRAHQNLTGKGYDPPLQALIKEHKSRTATLLTEAAIQRTFHVLFDTEELKNYLDLTAHQTSFVCPTPETLERYAKEGLFMFSTTL